MAPDRDQIYTRMSLNKYKKLDGNVLPHWIWHTVLPNTMESYPNNILLPRYQERESKRENKRETGEILSSINNNNNKPTGSDDDMAQLRVFARRGHHQDVWIVAAAASPPALLVVCVN